MKKKNNLTPLLHFTRKEVDYSVISMMKTLAKSKKKKKNQGNLR